MKFKNTAHQSAVLPNDLLLTKRFIYEVCDFECTHVCAEAESAEYCAYTFRINTMAVVYRVAKTTPTKSGQFVTLWKRNKGIIQPFELSDDIDFVVVTTRYNQHNGQFVFPKSVLFAKGIISGRDKEGKRGIRVYSPWDKATNKQAQKTQQWQGQYFLEISPENFIDTARAKQLYSKHSIP